MADKKISELTTASEIKNGDNLELSQDTGSGLVSLKATILAIANKMLNGINFTSDLQTTEKTVIGAINEVAQGGGSGSSTLDGLNDVDIDDTTLADGQALVYNGISEKWENGQGGGGTGGHTIIDENGTSMTARAGLQFVGGANVSDDSTNNKTIVDLASAGGIDGVFIDTENVITSGTYSASSPLSYIATEDCIVVIYLIANNSHSYLYIDNVMVYDVFSNGTQVFAPMIMLKKGQALSTVTSYSDASGYTVYGIQTGTTHSKFQPVIYSTEEREIGVYTDGKPLYEKTIDLGNLPNNTTKNVAHSISNLDKVTNMLGSGFNSSLKFPLPYVNADDVSNSVQIQINSTNIEIKSRIDFSSYSGYLTLQYTKTTDVAGSGTWTPQGVPTHHYSTTEQIIGTWIDGSTLYEKTIYYAGGSNGNINVAHGISNFGTLVNAYGSCRDTYGDGTGQFVIPRIENANIGIAGVNPTNVTYYVDSAFSDRIVDVYITLQYTKSS